MVENYKGEPISGKDFYSLLSQTEDFTVELGKLTLASGKLEAELIMYFRRCGITDDLKKATLGTLINHDKKKDLFSQNTLDILNQLNTQRIEFIHRLYSLFIKVYDDSNLPINDLIDTDVLAYIDYAWQLRKNLEGLAESIANK